MASRLGLLAFAVAEVAFGGWLLRVAAHEDALLGGIGLALFGAVAPAAVALLYAVRARIVATDDVLLLVGCLSERRIPWVDVVGADPGYFGMTVYLRNGSSVVAGAVQKTNLSSWLGRRTRADAVAEFIRERALRAAPAGQ